MPVISKNTQDAYPGLNDAFQRILERDGEHELLRLLVDMLEAGHIQWCKETSGDSIQYFMAAKDTRFATRFLAIENEVRSAIAEMFLGGRLKFSIDIHPVNVRWHVRYPSGKAQVRDTPSARYLF